MILLLDNYDSFTYNLVDYIQQLGMTCKVYRNDHNFDEITADDYKGVVLSPGPEVPRKSGQLMKVLEHYKDKTPILGICLGHQAIGELFGEKLFKAQKPMHGKICSIKVDDDPLFRLLPEQFSVVRYNSLIISDISAQLQVIARSESEEVMAIRHKQLPIWGVQFHPEAAMTEHGLKILKNWLDYNNITV
ncbi:MAG: aminodeoxychorismate/anthranilate synthase component II [Fulvivirga sp.]